MQPPLNFELLMSLLVTRVQFGESRSRQQGAPGSCTAYEWLSD